MTDIDWLYLLLALSRKSESKTDNERKNDMASCNNTIREVFEETIRRKLENHDVPSSEVEELARAYSELTKNDHLHEMMRSLNGNYPALNTNEVTNNG